MNLLSAFSNHYNCLSLHLQSSVEEDFKVTRHPLSIEDQARPDVAHNWPQLIHRSSTQSSHPSY